MGENRVSSSFRLSALAAVFFVLVSLLMVGPHVYPPTRLSDFSYASSDSFIFFWDFWWTKKALIEMVNPFETDYLFYPTGTDLSFHSYPLPYSVISLLFQAAIAGPEGLSVAFNAIVFASFVLSGFGAYRLALYVTGSMAGSLLAGLVFAFMPFRFLNMSRLHLLATELLPFYVLALLRFLDQPSWRRAAAMGGLLALCLYTSQEYALYLVIFSALLLAYRGFVRTLKASSLKHLALGAALFTLLASPLLLAQMNARVEKRAQAEYPIRSLNRWAPALLSFVTPTRYHPLYGSELRFAGEFGDDSGIHPPGMRSETYVGLALLFLALLGVAEARRNRSSFWLVAAIAFLLLTLGPYLRLTGSWQTNVPLPYHVLYWALPFLRASRDSTRFFPLMMLSLAVLASFGLGSLLQSVKKSAIASAALCGFFFVVVLFEYMVPAPRMQHLGVDPFYDQIAGDEGDFAVIDLSFEKAAVLAQTVHGRKITAGALIVPRSASARSSLSVERAFLNPIEVLNLPHDEMSARIDWDRSEILRHRIRYIVYPGGSAGPRLRLAKLLGARVTIRPPLVFCTFEGARW